MASGIAAGAQAGAAFGPWGAAIGGVLGGVADVAGGSSAGPNVSGGGFSDLRSFMDGSGWTVSTGSSKATGGARTQTDPYYASSAGTMLSGLTGGAGAGAAGIPWGLLIVGVFVLAALKKAKA